MRLSLLKKGDSARVARLSSEDQSLEAKLREIGFAEGDEIEIVHYGPFGAKPICVRLNQTLIALRREEAAVIEVEPIS